MVRNIWSPYITDEEPLGTSSTKNKRNEALRIVASFLDVAICEVFYMNVEPYVAVGEGMKSMELLGVGKKGRGLGNGVVRRCIREHEGKIKGEDVEEDCRGNMGTWLRDRIEKQGGDVSSVSRVYTLCIPGVYVTVKGPQDSLKSLKSCGAEDVMMKMRERGMNVERVEGGSLKVMGGGRIKDWVGYDEVRTCLFIDEGKERRGRDCKGILMEFLRGGI